MKRFMNTLKLNGCNAIRNTDVEVLPVGDEAGVDVSVLALEALLGDGHLADRSPQPREEQA